MALITAYQIKDKVDNRDLDTNLITDELIEMAQVKHLRPILTKDLYNDLVVSPSNYTSLLAVISEPLAWFVYFELMLIYYVSITEQGLHFNDSNKQTNIDTPTYDKLKAWAYQSAMTYYSDILDDIEDNNYELYESNKTLNKKIIGGILI